MNVQPHRRRSGKPIELNFSESAEFTLMMLTGVRPQICPEWKFKAFLTSSRGAQQAAPMLRKQVSFPLGIWAYSAFAVDLVTCASPRLSRKILQSSRVSPEQKLGNYTIW